MIIGREHLIFFEDLAKRQSQIYPDACDYGVHYNEINIEKVKAITADLKETFKCEREEWKNGASVKFFIPFEMDYRQYVGVNLKLACHINKSRKIKFLTIDIDRASQKHSGFLND